MNFNPGRRDALKAAAAAVVAGSTGAIGLMGVRASAAPAVLPPQAGTGAVAGVEDWSGLRLWYPRPATSWVEALPLGNGRLGAMVWGAGNHERLQINEDTLYAGGPYRAESPDALAALPEVQALIFAGRYAEAEALANAKMMARPLKQMPYQPLADLVLDVRNVAELDDYRRELDIDGALASTHFRSRGVSHERQAFASAVDQCVAVRLSTAQPGFLGFRIGLESEQDVEATATGAELFLRGRNQGRSGIEGGLRFVARVRVIPAGGRVFVEGNRLVVEGADEAVVLLTAATSYRRFDDVSGNPEAITRAHLDAAAARSWGALLADHQAEHRALFRRVSLDLGATPAAERPTDERVARFHEGGDPALAMLSHQFGRYLLIASSRPGSQPANLQGIWNNLMDPPWESKYTVNINTEMNYWPSEANALPECVEPLERMVRELAESGAITARSMYGAPGWVVHNNTDLWRQASPPDGAKWALWPLGGAWLLQQLWDRWDYGRDLGYLRSVYPLFRGAAEFFAATLVEDPGTGAMVTNPSLSPENVHPHGASLCAGPSMDAQILRDLFGQCMEASALLGMDAEFAESLRGLRERLPPHRIGRAGQLQEWQHDWDMQAPETDHRHVSHLYALHPSSQINVRDTPELARAARRSLEIRGDEATGWGIGWRLNLWARLRDPERAHAALERLLHPSRSYPNLFSAHPPFQIDGNFGGTAGITEMLLQSWGGSIFVLPALPKAWPEGGVRGLRVRNAAGIDLAWRGGILARARLRSDKGGTYELVHRGQALSLQLAAGETALLEFRDKDWVRA